MLTLSNVGRVEHNIAHYLNALSNAKKPSYRILLFVKDTNDQKVHQPYQEKVLLAQMVSQAATSTLGFACGLVPVFQGYTNNRTMSIWHDTSRLMTFSLPRYGNGRYNKSTHDVKFNSEKSFSEWAESMQIRFPTPLAPVYYGGSFAVKQSNIARSQRSFKHLDLSFSRGDNIVEGHYGERSWAAILMPRISQNVTHILQHMAFEVLNSYYVGVLLGCNSSHPRGWLPTTSIAWRGRSGPEVDELTAIQRTRLGWRQIQKKIGFCLRWMTQGATASYSATSISGTTRYIPRWTCSAMFGIQSGKWT